MKILLFIFLLVASNHLMAQSDTGKIIRADTINLRGMVYSVDGKPARNIRVLSRATNFNANEYRLIAYTDTNGFFTLKGAKPNDTLGVFTEDNNLISFPNFGSRFMVIYLPRQIIQINSSAPIDINAPRKYPKVQPELRSKQSGIYDAYCVGLRPIYNGGIEAFLNYIKHNLVYPEKAIRYNVEGTVEAGFIIDKNGALSNIKILKGIGYGCDEEIIEVLTRSPRWMPGIPCGPPHPVQESVSVKFSLTDK